MWCASRHTLRSCNACDVVVNVWILIPCEDGAPCRRINENEKLSVEIDGLETTCKLMAAAVGLCLHNVRICDGSCWVWSNGSDLEMGECEESILVGAAVSRVWSRKLSIAREACSASKW